MPHDCTAPWTAWTWMCASSTSPTTKRSPVKRSNEQSLNTALDLMIDSFGLREKMDELDITTGWDEIAGPMIARHTISVRLRKGRL
ncbi:MAG: DUF721 domain-containing protein, partial [Flavobacteriales bacterium]|nr:DUF721 domain-containing protein [Flavobacteriales bacterium]